MGEALFCVLKGLTSEAQNPFLDRKHPFLFKAVERPDHCWKKRGEIFPSPFNQSDVTDVVTLSTSTT